VLYNLSYLQLQSPVPILQFPPVFPAHVHCTLANSSPSSQPALLNHHSVSPFLYPWSLLISCSPIETYPSLHHVSGMTYHMNSAPFLYLHHRHFQSQDIIFTRLLYPSSPGLSSQNLNVISSDTPTLTHLIIHPPHPNDTHLNSYSVPSWYSENRT